jgi:hypothetical protein
MESETRAPLSKKGTVRFTVGVDGFAPLGHGGTGAGFSLGVVYATPSFALPVDFRFGAQPDSGGRDASFFAVSAGARRYFSTRDTSPFLGAGLSMLGQDASEGQYGAIGDHYFDGDSFGVAPYVEGGVELLRLHRARLGLLAHVDVPLSAVYSEAYPVYTWDPVTGGMTERMMPAEERYVLPMTFGVRVAF